MSIIEEGIRNNNLKEILEGEGYYYIKSREDSFSEQAYEVILPIFAQYNENHPEDNLKEKYVKTLEELLKSDLAYDILCGCECVMKQVELEKKQDFNFRIKEKQELLELAKFRVKEKQADMTKLMATISSPPVAANYYDRLSEEIDTKINGISK